jgi:hypothetical protein
MKFIDQFPIPLLVGMAVFMLASPFVPEPHLVEKMRMLADGTLTRPMDIFDVIWHLLPSALLWIRLARRKRPGKK